MGQNNIKKEKKDKLILKPAVPLGQIKGLSFNTQNLFMNKDSEETKKRILIFTDRKSVV